MGNSLALWEMKASSFEEAQKIATLVSNSAACAPLLTAPAPPETSPAMSFLPVLTARPSA